MGVGQRRDRADRAARPGGYGGPRAPARPGRRPELRHPGRDLRREARRRAGGCSPPSPSRVNQTVTAKPALPAKLPIGDDLHRRRRRGRRHALPRAGRARSDGRDITVAAIPLSATDDTLQRLLVVEALVIAGVLIVLGPRLVGRRARRPAAAGPHGPHRGRDRRRRPLPPRRVDRPAHRGRPPGHRAQRDARPPRAGLRRARGQRGPPAALHRRRLARAAHAAGLDPRLRRALPHGRRARARPTSRRRWGASRTRPRGWACWSRTC